MQKTILDEIFDRLPGGKVTVHYWDGSSRTYGEGEPRFTIRFNQPLSAARIAKDPILEIGEAYMEGAIDVDGDLREAIRWAFANQEILLASTVGKLSNKIFGRINKGANISQQKKDVQYHYDLGNDFYALWLDDTMTYSCAYFHTPTDSLTDAQIQKVEHILKKLQLKPGETLLDIGSGWGELIIRAAKLYQVKTVGITLSEEQFKKTQERIQEMGLEGLAEVALLDYRQLAKQGRVFDKVVSVGMLEHVGQANLKAFMATLTQLLAPGGLALIHSITKLTEGPVNSWIEKHIFPGGYVPSLREIVWLLPEHDFHVMDIESLRLHYAMTLDRWGENFDRHVHHIKEKYGEKFVRMWRLYLYGCAESFRSSGLDVHQILFSKNLNNDLPLTRAHLYRM